MVAAAAGKKAILKLATMWRHWQAGARPVQKKGAHTLPEKIKQQPKNILNTASKQTPKPSVENQQPKQPIPIIFMLMKNYQLNSIAPFVISLTKANHTANKTDQHG